MNFQVRFNGVPCVREDLYDGTNPEVLEQLALFDSRSSAEAFVHDVCGQMHMGGNPDEFQIVPSCCVETGTPGEA